MELFRTLILLLMLAAPGDVRCDAPLATATVCRVSFANPAYVETVTSSTPARIRALIEIKQAGK